MSRLLEILTLLRDIETLEQMQAGPTAGVVGLDWRVAIVDATGAAISSTNPSTASGTLTNNNAAPAANNLGVLPALANAAVPTDTEGDQVLLSTDLSGRLRTLASCVGFAAPGGATPNPVGMGLNGTGGLLRNVTSALAAYPDTGNLLIGTGPGVFDGSNWHGLKGATDGTLLVGGFETVISATLTRPADTNTYTAGDEITDTGGAIRTLTGMARASGGSGTIQGVGLSISSNGSPLPSLELWIFDTTSTPAVDNAAFAPSDGVVDTAIAVIPMTATYIGTTGASGNVFMDTGSINFPFLTVGSANLFLRVVVRNGYIAGANSDTYKFRFRVSQD